MTIANETRKQLKGPARCFNSEREAASVVRKGQVQPGDVVVLRYEGPVGGPGMPEMMTALTGALAGEGVPMGRLAYLDEIVSDVVHLASDEARLTYPEQDWSSTAARSRNSSSLQLPPP